MSTQFALWYRYLWITIVYNITYSVALFALLMFYLGTHDMLAPFNPLLKFILVKSVVFFTFWQVCAPCQEWPCAQCCAWSMVICRIVWTRTRLQLTTRIAQGIGLAILVGTGAIATAEDAGNVQNLLICLEMLPASAAMFFAFPYSEYLEGGTSCARSHHASFRGCLRADLLTTGYIQPTGVVACAHNEAQRP